MIVADLRYNKMLKARPTWNEWRQCTQPMKLRHIHEFDVSQESSFLGKAIAIMKNASGSFYVAYLFTAFFLYDIFLRWIRPRVIGSNS